TNLNAVVGVEDDDGPRAQESATPATKRRPPPAILPPPPASKPVSPNAEEATPVLPKPKGKKSGGRKRPLEEDKADEAKDCLSQKDLRGQPWVTVTRGCGVCHHVTPSDSPTSNVHIDVGITPHSIDPTWVKELCCEGGCSSSAARGIRSSLMSETKRSAGPSTMHGVVLLLTHEALLDAYRSHHEKAV
ncbi:hypothetical protein BDN72DRAFT_865880, partial [Pluteus cervinus]